MNELNQNQARESLYANLRELHSYGFWTTLKEQEPTDPIVREVPHVWKFQDFLPQLNRAAELVPVEEAERRGIILHNPAYDMSKPFTTNTLFSAYQIINPGEIASVHRHTPAASRMVLKSDRGFTTVEGEKCYLERGDLILTPNGTWHDHGNEGSESLIWNDTLDIPIPVFLNASYFEWGYEGSRASDTQQAANRSSEYSRKHYAGGGLLPRFADRKLGMGYGTPQIHFKYDDVRSRLESLRNEKGDPYDGIVIDFVNPLNGEPVTKTMNFSMQLLRKGENTAIHRHTSCHVYTVLEGSGHTMIDGKKYEWEENDIFCLPSLCWHEHVANADSDAVLYTVSDKTLLDKLGLYFEDRKAENGDIVRIGRD